MEPVTHVLTGACLARAGFHRRIAYATAAMAVAAEFPDIDTVSSFWGPVAGLQHHRGITHSFFGLPFEAALLVSLFYLWHRMRSRRSGSAPNTVRGGKPAVPVRWGSLYGAVLLALLSHLLLDYTNNYGLRPFLPFDGHWYAASIVFIFDPLLFAFLLAGLTLPLLFRLIGREIGVKRGALAHPGWALAALAGVVLLWTVRAVEHSRAVRLAEATSLRAPAMDDTELPQAGDLDAPRPAPAASGMPGEPGPDRARALLLPVKSLASPDPLSVFRWYTAVDYGPAYQLGVADTGVGTLVRGRTLVKAGTSPLLAKARLTRLGRVYLDWSMMPLVSVEADRDDDGRADRTVLFEDMRFLGDTPLLHRNALPPLTGEVLLDERGQVLDEGVDGRFRH